jgi:hypothetical protein
MFVSFERHCARLFKLESHLDLEEIDGVLGPSFLQLHSTFGQRTRRPMEDTKGIRESRNITCLSDAVPEQSITQQKAQVVIRRDAIGKNGVNCADSNVVLFKAIAVFSRTVCSS